MHSFGYAFQGIRTAVKTENNLRFHLLVTLVVIAGGMWAKLSRLEWCLILMCIGLVICCEIVNTAIEKLVDFVSPRYHPKAGVIKDIAAGAVLVACGIAIMIGSIVFGHYIMELLIT